MERLIAALDRVHAERRMQVAEEGIFVAVRSGLYTFRNRQFLCLLGNVAGLLYQRAARQKQHQQQCTYKCGGFLHKIPSCSIVSF